MSSPPLGLGACAFGAAPLGFGSPATADPRAPALLVQADGTPGECAAINTSTGDFILDDAGRKLGWDGLSQRVYLAVRTVLGSAADQGLGIDLPMGTITDDIANRIKLAVAAALKRLTDAGLIVIVSIDVSRAGQSAVRTEVRWRAVAGGPVRTTVA